MGSVTRQNQVPVLDFTGEALNPSSTRWLSTREEVVRALEEYGCFIANYGKVSLELHQAIFRASQELLDLPKETKVLSTSESPFRGYVGQMPSVPLLEGFGIDNAATVEGVQKFTNVLWPNGNNHLSETVLSYSKLVAELNHVVMRMVAETYGVEKDCEALLGSIYYRLGISEYRVPREDESNLGIIPHTDKTFMSVLHQTQVNGLEIKTKNGDWMLIDSSSPSSFVILAGDVCKAWSNGRIESPLHRVIMSGSEARNSINLFAFIRDVVVQVPEKLVDEEHPLQYKPFDPHKYLLFFYTEEGQKSECPLKSYCGV